MGTQNYQSQASVKQMHDRLMHKMRVHANEQIITTNILQVNSRNNQPSPLRNQRVVLEDLQVNQKHTDDMFDRESYLEYFPTPNMLSTQQFTIDEAKVDPDAKKAFKTDYFLFKNSNRGGGG